MTRWQKNEWYCVCGWALTFLAALVVTFYLTGCAGASRQADEAKATGCLEEVEFSVAQGLSCTAVVANVAELTRRRPECVAILGDAGLTLVCHDGGAHD